MAGFCFFEVYSMFSSSLSDSEESFDEQEDYNQSGWS